MDAHAKRPQRMKPLRALCSCTLLFLAATSQAASIDNFRISRIASITTIEIELGCAMRYLSHTPSGSGVELRIRVALGFDCTNALRNAPNSLYRPQGSRMASLSDVEFDLAGVGEGIITLRFQQPVAFEVSHTANQYLLTVAVDTSAPASAAPPEPPPAAKSEPTPAAPTSRVAGPSRSIQRRAPRSGEMFVIRLTELGTDDVVDRRALDGFESRAVYINVVTVGSQEWRELRMGFFENEAQALAVLAQVRSIYPTAWVSVATSEEQLFARDNRAAVSVSTESPPAPASPPQQPPDLSAERVSALMAEARDAILRSDFDRSIEIYSRVLQQPDAVPRAEAREYLGVARQKNGQIALAKTEYETYLSEFPGGPGRQRVQQRLAALTINANSRAVPLRQAARRDDAGKWQYSGGVSQFYLRGVNLARDDEEDVVTQSALLSQADFIFSRHGERFDLLGRANLAYLYNFDDETTENQARVSYAWLDIADTRLDLTARVGRQTLHKAGVLGRFDGAHLNYILWPNLSVSVTAGFPVDSPRYLASADRYFYGASAELANIKDAVDISVFTNLQTVDGISDRKAVGANAHFHSSRLNIVGLLDYDMSYNIINTALIQGNWRPFDRLTLNARYQGGTSPFLTTRNAIIGQPVNTVEALLETYTAGQVRRLARNRTADARYASAGMSFELSQRWQLNADLNFNEFSSTVASGGVAAIPETGPQYVWGGHLLGSSLYRSGDSILLGYRHFESRRNDSDTLILDMRFPFGDGLRINPKLALTSQKRVAETGGESQQWIVNPMLRVIYRARRSFRIEFEVGGQWSDQELPEGVTSPFAPDGSIESSAYYLQLGYWLDFR